MRTYVCDFAGAGSSTVQIQSNGSLRRIILSAVNAAVGKLEVSLSAASQIGTAQPTSDVLFRANFSATAGQNNSVIDFDPPASASTKLKAFQSVYIHVTGAANTGTVSMLVA